MSTSRLTVNYWVMYRVMFVNARALFGVKGKLRYIFAAVLVVMYRVAEAADGERRCKRRAG